MKIKHVITIVLIILAAVAITGAVGLVLGAGIGSNYGSEGKCSEVINSVKCEESYGFIYQGLPGYEGGGLLGLHLGSVVGLGVGIYISSQYLKKKRTS